MKPSTLIATLPSLILAGRPVMVEGSPGLGKTRIPEQIIAKDDRFAGWGLVIKHAPTMQPEDLGLPAITADRKSHTFTRPDWWPVVGDDSSPEHGLIVIDEAPQADNSVQKTLANMVQERELHGHKMKPGWTFLMTGNRQADRAGANRILSHLRDRMITVELEPNLDDWCAWAVSTGVEPAIVSFLRFKPNMLCNFDPQREINATPRGWAEKVNDIIGNVPAESEFECLKGAVGEGPAAEFNGYLKIVRKLEDPDKVIANPEKAKVPDEPSVLFAMAGAIAYRATPENFENVMTYAKRLPPEFMVLTVRDACQRDPALHRHPSFTKWASKEGAKVLL